MNRVLPIAAILVGLLLAWMVREDDGARTARNTVAPGATPETTRSPENTVARLAEPERPGSEDAALLTGLVTGPNGPVWGAQVRVHARGESTAFDETTTKVDGTYRLELAVAAEGESIDVSARAAADEALSGERIDGIDVQRGQTIHRDFTFTPALVIEGTVSVIGSPYGRRSVALVRLEDWLTAVAEAGGEYPTGKPLEPIAVVRTSKKFRFAQTPPGRYVVTCDDRYAVAIAPPIVEPGDTDVRVQATRVFSSRMTVLDAVSGQPVDLATASLVGFPSDARLTRASGDGAGFPVRLRLDAAKPNQPTLMRVSAKGYHECEYVLLREGAAAVTLAFLVPASSPTLTLHLRGDGAAAFAKNVRLGTRIPFKRADGVVSHMLPVVLPLLEVNVDSLRTSLPVGAWSLGFSGMAARVGNATQLSVQIRNAGDTELTLQIPQAATIDIDWAENRMPAWNQVWMTGGRMEWVQGEDGVLRLVQNSGVTTKVSLYRPTGSASMPPKHFIIAPGIWSITRRNVTGGVRSFPVDLAPGARITLALGR